MHKKPSEYLRIKRNYLRKKLIEIKGGKCRFCGYSKCVNALEFHHRKPQEKKFNLSGINLTKNSWQKIIIEANKCDLLCANCHAEINAPSLTP